MHAIFLIRSKSRTYFLILIRSVFVSAVTLAGGIPQAVTLRKPSFAIDIDDIRATLTSDSAILVLNTPHNPTGKVATKEELEGGQKIQRETVG
jgi:aspartate/methionine/tyrosine aminotransferase